MRYRRVLVIIKGYIGDAVMAAPMLASLGQISDHIDILSAAKLDSVLASPDGKRAFLRQRKLSNGLELLRQAKELRARQYDAAVVVNRSFRAALLARLAGIPIRVGHPVEARGALLTHHVRFHPHDFEARADLDLAVALGGPDLDPHPRLPMTDEERARGKELIQGAEVGIQPGARFPEKQLPFDLLVEVVTHIHGLGYGVVMLGGPDEQEAARRLTEALPFPLVDLVGQTSLRETMGALSHLKLAVGSDTGVMHLAVAVGCPTVTAFGPTPYEKWRHDYPPHRALLAPERRIQNFKAADLLEVILPALERT